MANFIGSGGVHDVGGAVGELENGGFIDIKDKKLQHWELSIHALLVLLASRSPALMTTDELRRGVEALEPVIYNSWGYYERWAAAMTAILLERGVFTQLQWDQYLSGDEYVTTEAHSVKFSVGQHVKIRKENSRIRWRRPHIRCPGYIFGVSGVISNVIGVFDDPFMLAFRGKGPKQPLYTVIVKLRDLWAGGKYPTGDITSADQSYAADDVIEIEVYQDWLEENHDALAHQHNEHDHSHEHYHEHCRDHAHNHCDSKHADCEHHHHQHDVVEAGVIADRDQTAHAALSEHSHSHEHSHEHGHEHKHGHDHHHTASTSASTTCAASVQDEITPGQVVAETLLRLLTDLQVIQTEKVHQTIDKLESAGRRLTGATLVARAWKDAAFKARLLANPAAAGLEVDVVTSNPNAPTVLRVVENTPETHHAVVCTLCSCYPAALLGLSPAWYKSRNYRARMVREPRRVLQDTFGLVLPTTQRIMVHDSTADCRYLVLPMPPKELVASGAIDSLSWEELVPYVTRNSMVGVEVL